MSNGATNERATPHAEAYNFERRKADAIKHIKSVMTSGGILRPGHIARTYGGDLFGKVEVQSWIRGFNEIAGGDGK